MAAISSPVLDVLDIHPLLFNTVSPADMHQTFLFRAILADQDFVDETGTVVSADLRRHELLVNKEKEMTSSERFKELGANPKLAVDHFWALVQEIERLLKSDAKPLGHVLDIWYADAR